jgi:ABC-type sugar transport system ATPase subunit
MITACLTDKEVTILFRLIEELKAEGKIILYVSHDGRDFQVFGRHCRFEGRTAR